MSRLLRSVVISAAVLAPVLFGARAALAAHVAGPPPCDNWKSAVDGNWNDATKWSSGVPDSTKQACITLAGTYTVTVNDNEEADALQLGSGTAEQPTLAISVIGSSHLAELTLDEDVTNDGATITMTSTGNTTSMEDVLDWNGTLTNSGTISTLATNVHLVAFLEGDLVNNGTVSIGTATNYDVAPAEFDNFGEVSVDAGKSFTMSGANEFVDGADGTVSNSGTFLVSNNATFSLKGGIVNDNPITAQFATIVDRSSESADFEFTAGGTFLGNVASGQTLTVASLTGNSSADVVVPASFTNAGTIDLTSNGNIHASSEESSLAWNGTLTNSGTIDVESGAVSDFRYLQGNLVNTGTIDVTSPLANYTPSSPNGGLLTNRKTITVAPAGVLTLSEATLTNIQGGSIANSGAVLLTNDSVFEEGAGRTSGTAISLTNSSTLDFEGTGTSKFQFLASGELTGDIGPNQSVTIAAVTATNGTDVTAPASFTNAGTITLTTVGANTGAAEDAELEWSGRLTNTGTINAIPGTTGGGRFFEGNYLDNGGTINATINTVGDNSRTKWTNSGTIKLAANRTLSLPNGGIFRQTSAGTLSSAVTSVRAGSIVAQGHSYLDGALLMTGTPTAGHAYTVIGPTVVTGTFASVTPASYSPTYTATRVTVTSS